MDERNRKATEFYRRAAMLWDLLILDIEYLLSDELGRE